MHFSQSKSTKCEILAISWTPPDKKLKKNFNLPQGKSVHKDLQICTYRFLGMPIAMHYGTTLCDKYFLNYYGFSAFVMGRSRYRILKHGVRVKCDPRRTAAYVPSHFHGCEPHLLLCVSQNCDFSWTNYHRDLQQVPLDSACLKPYICTTQAISMHFSQSNSTKHEIYATL